MKGKFPRTVKITLVLVLLGVIAVAAFAHEIAQQRQENQQRVCELSVSYRADNRAMWLYLLTSQDVDPKDPKVVAFKNELNERLPPLECVNRIAVPVEDQ